MKVPKGAFNHQHAGQQQRNLKTLTGSEFARHHELHALGIETFFCDTYSPWQKGGVENAIGRMRRSLPRKTDLVHLPEERFTQMLQAYNNTPRKCLGYQTPAETFWNKVLRFKCESTFRPAPERRWNGGCAFRFCVVGVLAWPRQCPWVPACAGTTVGVCGSVGEQCCRCRRLPQIPRLRSG